MLNGGLSLVLGTFFSVPELPFDEQEYSVLSFSLTKPTQCEKTIVIYPVNENGQTYGPNTPWTTYPPDLIKASGVDGTEGYILRKDSYGETSKIREEAIAKMDKGKQEGGNFIPLYAVDGKTVIGEFFIGNTRAEEFEWKKKLTNERK